LPFPQSDAVDLQAQFGWYYAAGNVVGDDGKQYGVMLMLVSTPMLPPTSATALEISDTENESTQLQLEINQGGGFHYEASSPWCKWSALIAASSPSPRRRASIERG